jgi:c-di-GMP phosphodiesterase
MSQSAGGFITYAPVLDPGMGLSGLRLAVHARNPMVGLATIQGLARAWPSESVDVMVDAEDASPGPAFSAVHLPANGLLHLGGDPSPHRDWMESANGHCPAIALAPEFQAVWPSAQIVMPAHRLAAGSPGDSGTSCKGWVTGADSPADFERASRAGAAHISGWPFLAREATAGRKRGVPPSAASVIKLIDLVNRDADIADIGAILKRDVVLGYKLVALVNSAAHGLPVEIHSYQHAITMLGLTRLKRWLSLLLVTCGGGNQPTVLLRTALIRAAFFEEIGRQLGYVDDADDLFLCGAFSLLDVILGMDFAEILDEVSLPERIADALLNEGEPFGPLLRLMRAIEGSDAAAVEAVAGPLMLPPARCNAALLLALRAGLRVDLG